MRFLLHFTAAALLVAIGIGGMTSASAADREARAAVLGRQKIREELSAALQKGYLTRMDQYHILLHAKEVLSADDLHGLEQTLDRIATRQALARPAATPVRSEAPVQHSTKVSKQDGNPGLVTPSKEDSKAGVITPSKYEEPKAAEIAEMPVIDPTPKKANALSESSLAEEVPAGIGKPTIQVDSDDLESCGCDSDECHPRRRWIDFDFFTSIDGFKGPLDLGNSNGNFGTRLGVNAAMPVLPRWGVALQAGTSVILSDFKGTGIPEPNATIRDQIFTTVGMFQRINLAEGAVTWGFAYDWLFDNYYDSFEFGQWRVKAAWEVSPCDEIGILAAVPEHGSSGTVPNFITGLPDVVTFKPITQGYLYWKHTWSNDASLTGRFGVAERPGQFVFGAESRVPLTNNLALASDFSYIMPTEPGGIVGQTQEVWNVSVGIEFVLGGRCRGCAARCQPFLPVADNGSFAIRESDNGASE